MKLAKNKSSISMIKLTQGYEKFIKGKEVLGNWKAKFDKAIKKATKPKPHGPK